MKGKCRYIDDEGYCGISNDQCIGEDRSYCASYEEEYDSENPDHERVWEEN